MATNHSKAAIAGFVLSLFGVLILIVPSLPVAFLVPGLLLSINGRKSTHRGLATAGLVLAIIGLVGAVAWFLLLLAGVSIFSTFIETFSALPQ